MSVTTSYGTGGKVEKMAQALSRDQEGGQEGASKGGMWKQKKQKEPKRKHLAKELRILPSPTPQSGPGRCGNDPGPKNEVCKFLLWVGILSQNVFKS